MKETGDLLEKADDSIADFLQVDARNCKPDEFGRLYQKANIGLRIRHDAIVNGRIEVDQKLRAIAMAISDPKMREEYIRVSSPKMLPELRKAS